MTVTAEEFETIDIEKPIRGSRNIDCWRLGKLYAEAASKERELGNATASRVFEVLSDVAHIHFKPDDMSEPYGPQFVINGQRSSVPSDFLGDQSTVFVELVPSICNPGLRARLADIAWCNDRKLADMARQAINAYCKAVQLVIDGTNVFFDEDRTASCIGSCNMLRRACQISHATGWKNPQASRLRTLVGTVTQDAIDRRDYRGFINVGEVVLQFDIGDLSIIATNAETFAESKDMDPVWSRHLWELAAEAHQKTGDTGEHNRCVACVAETFVVSADASGGEGMVAASFLENAIEILRTLPNTKERRKELGEQLRHAQASVLDEMHTVSIPVDLTEVINRTQQSVANKNLAQILAAFAELTKSPDPSALKEDAQHLATRSPLQNLMPTTHVDKDGRTVEKSPEFTSGENDSDTLRPLIIQAESVRRHICVNGQIEPVRQLIQSEHSLHRHDLRLIVETTPFTPIDRTDLITTGLTRFFGGDFFSALHILVPQLENTLRHILKHAGENISVIHNDMTQEDPGLSSLLTKHRGLLERILGPAIVFEIENLFHSGDGPTLRHHLAHGKISAAECYGTDSIYACWFMFRLFFLPLLPDWNDLARKLCTP